MQEVRGCGDDFFCKDTENAVKINNSPRFTAFTAFTAKRCTNKLFFSPHFTAFLTKIYRQTSTRDITGSNYPKNTETKVDQIPGHIMLEKACHLEKLNFLMCSIFHGTVISRKMRSFLSSVDRGGAKQWLERQKSVRKLDFFCPHA